MHSPAQMVHVFIEMHKFSSGHKLGKIWAQIKVIGTSFELVLEKLFFVKINHKFCSHLFKKFHPKFIRSWAIGPRKIAII